MKHFALNDCEQERIGQAAWLTEQAARENGLRAFEGAVKGDSLLGVMSAYNRVGTTFAGGHDGLMTQILRTE
jgi:beta-glucosidase